MSEVVANIPTLTEFVELLGCPRTQQTLFAYEIVRSLGDIPEEIKIDRMLAINSLHRREFWNPYRQVYSPRTADRALLLLETHGIIRCVSAPRGPRRGAVYVMQPRSKWLANDPKRVMRRRRTRYPGRGLRQKMVVASKAYTA